MGSKHMGEEPSSYTSYDLLGIRLGSKPLKGSMGLKSNQAGGIWEMAPGMDFASPMEMGMA